MNKPSEVRVGQRWSLVTGSYCVVLKVSDSGIALVGWPTSRSTHQCSEFLRDPNWFFLSEEVSHQPIGPINAQPENPWLNYEAPFTDLTKDEILEKLREATVYTEANQPKEPVVGRWCANCNQVHDMGKGCDAFPR
jgi:hypothetical protein